MSDKNGGITRSCEPSWIDCAGKSSLILRRDVSQPLGDLFKAFAGWDVLAIATWTRQSVRRYSKDGEATCNKAAGWNLNVKFGNPPLVWAYQSSLGSADQNGHILSPTLLAEPQVSAFCFAAIHPLIVPTALGA